MLRRLARRLSRKGKLAAKKSYDESNKMPEFSVEAPKVFSLRDPVDHQNVLDFIDDIFSNLRPKEKLRLDFSKTEGMFVDAALVFMANLDKALKYRPAEALIKVAPAKLRPINAVLTQIGVLELCDQDFHINPLEEGAADWLGFSGDSEEKFIPKDIYDYLEKAYKKPPPRLLFSAINEALLNIKHHAYCDSESGTWWMLAKKSDDKFTIVVCDVGVGIPVSLQVGVEEHQRLATRYAAKLFSKVKRPIKDSEMIRASMKIGESRTRQGHRGKGLPAMMNVIGQVKDKSLALSIYSNSGSFTKFGNINKPILTNYQNSIGGTVVGWTLPASIDDMMES